MVADDGALGGLPEEDGVGPYYECRYEDEYDGVVYSTFSAPLSAFEQYAEGSVAHLNVPVWVEHVTDEEQPPFVALGMMLTRKGECRIWKAPATTAEAQELRQRTLRVWAHRADAQLRRYGFPVESTESPN